MSKLLFLFIGLIFISGCVQSGPKSATQGVVISSWKTDFQIVSPNQPVEFELGLKNIGQNDGSNIQVSVEGIDNWKPDVNCNIQKLFSKRGEIEDNKKCYIKATAPDLPSGFKNAAEAKAVVSYGYGSTAVKSLNIRSLAEARRLMESGQAIQVSDIEAQTESPIQFNIITKTPITVSSNKITTPVLIKVKNTGGGIVCHPDCSNSKNWNKIQYTLDSVADNIQFSDSCQRTGIIDLLQSEENVLKCTKIIISASPSDFEKFPLLRVKADYGYRTEAATTITIDNSGQI